MISKKEVLEKAMAAVANREDRYDDPITNFYRTARLWHAHLLNRYERIEAYRIPPLDAIDVALMLDLVKTSRLEFDPSHLDSWVDKAGYSACGARCAVKEEDDKIMSSPPDQTDSEFRWIDGVEYQWVTTTYETAPNWYATGRHHPGLTNTPHRGEILGSRKR